MAEAAIKREYQYIAITDHTRGLKIAGGLDEERLEQQGREIIELNQRFRKRGTDFTVLRSAEVNLSPKGGRRYRVLYAPKIGTRAWLLPLGASQSR